MPHLVSIKQSNSDSVVVTVITAVAGVTAVTEVISKSSELLYRK